MFGTIILVLMCAHKVLLLSATAEFRVSVFSQGCCYHAEAVDKMMRKHSAAEGQREIQHGENQYTSMTKGGRDASDKNRCFTVEIYH